VVILLGSVLVMQGVQTSVFVGSQISELEGGVHQVRGAMLGEIV